MKTTLTLSLFLSASLAFGALSTLALAESAGMATSVQPSTTKPAPSAKPEKPQPTLKVGSEAPKLSVEEWVKGDSMQELEAGKVYIVEFWATWCPPCVKAIPHLTELQAKHRADGLTVIGVAASERQKSQGGPDTRLDGVKQFVKGKGKQMDYTVAYDADRSMSTAWMLPAGRTGIPSSFVVGHDGKIAWIGNPHDSGFDSAVETAVKAGKKARDEGKKDEGGKKQEEGDAEQKKKDQRAPFKKN